MKQKAIKAIEDKGGLLVFPIDNRRDPDSLWYTLHPRTEMRWEWDESGDDRVANLWHLREELSRSGKVVYAKWYQGRATFFSKATFSALYAGLQSVPLPVGSARDLLAVLEDNSPLSTKELKKAVDLVGKDREAEYNRGMKALWDRLLIVGCGEKDDGAFPSLLVGATGLIFDELVRQARKLKPHDVDERLAWLFKKQPLFQKYWQRIGALPKARTVKKSKGSPGGIIRGEDLFLK